MYISLFFCCLLFCFFPFFPFCCVFSMALHCIVGWMDGLGYTLVHCSQSVSTYIILFSFDLLQCLRCPSLLHSDGVGISLLDWFMGLIHTAFGVWLLYVHGSYCVFIKENCYRVRFVVVLFGTFKAKRPMRIVLPCPLGSNLLKELKRHA